MLKKLLFLYHLMFLPHTALAYKIQTIQKEEEGERKYQCLVSECKVFLEELDITNNPTSYSKSQWSKLIREKVHHKNERDILSKMTEYSKLDIEKFSSEDYGIKEYISSFNISEARTMFSARSSMLSTVQTNFKNHPQYRANEYKCKCGELDTQSNLLPYRLYSHLREGLDLSNSDSDLVRYYQLVIQERMKEQER